MFNNYLRAAVSKKQSRQYRRLKHCAAIMTTIASLAFSSQAFSMPTVSDQTILFPDDGWYQVQVQGDFDSDVCQGRLSCDVEPGTYLVINLTTGVRTPNVVVTGVEAPGESPRPIVMGNTISWEDNGWYQVQVQGDFESDVCQGGTSCEVEPGTYLVINLTTGERFRDVVVTGDSGSAVNIFDTLVAAGNFTSLIAAIEDHGVEEVLTDESIDFTLFAPTDDAFAMLDPELVANLENDGAAVLDLLANHVVFGQALDATTLFSLEGTEISNARSEDTGELLSVTVEDGSLFIDDAQVTVADIEASNGFIHVIDSVLVPSMLEIQPLPVSPGTILDVAEGAGEFGLLLGALEVAGLTDTLDNPNDFYTVFAPTDDAINALGQDAIDALLNDPEALRQILSFHLIPGTVFQSADFANILGLGIQAGNGGSLTVMDTGEGLTVNGVNIVIADIQADNGVIHVIDAVLIP